MVIISCPGVNECYMGAEVDGNLVATEESDLNMLPDPVSNRLSYCREATPTTMSTSPPPLPLLKEEPAEETESSGDIPVSGIEGKLLLLL